jgi:adenylate cyclase
VLHELAREWGDVQVDLDQADGKAFVEDYIDSEPNHLGKDFRQRLYNHTAGNPLFTVELLRCFERLEMVVRDESRRWVEAPGLDWAYCPPQVEEVISAHLQALPDDDQALLQAASIQGEQFIAEVVAHVLGRDENAVLQRLSGPLRKQHRLVEAFSFERLPSSGRRLSYYHFRHALVQRSAYKSLDVIRQAQLHETTGRALEALYAVQREKPYNLAPTLARHFEAAGLNLAAAHALYDAGCLAVRMSSFHEALKLFDHGLTLLANEPPVSERTEIEQSLQVARLGPQRNLDGLSGAGVGGALTRATEAGAGEASGRSRLLMLLSEGERLSVMGRLPDALTRAERLLDLATQWEDETFIALAHWRYGFTYSVIGSLQESERHFNWIAAWLTPERSTELRGLVGFGLSAHLLTFSALNQWWLGYPEQAFKRSADAVNSAIEQGDHYGQAIATAVGSTLLFLLRRDPAELQERSEMCRQLCQQHGFTMWEIYAEVFRGWLAVMRGEVEAGVGEMQGAVARWQAKGMAAGVDALTIALADGCLAAARRLPPNELEARAALLATGLDRIEALLGPQVPCGQSYQAELYRLKGELLLERDGSAGALAAADEALACFERALRLGREMGAFAWELRAAMSLVRLRMRQGEAYAAELAEAQACLREVYERFTEGFEFPDMREAAALIGQEVLTGSGSRR